jgi:hypothetical protein
MHKTNTVIVVNWLNSPAEPADGKRDLAIICSTSECKDYHLKDIGGRSTTEITIHLDMDRTAYFRQFQYCSDCHEPTIDVSAKLAYVMEVPHTASTGSEDQWHFEMLVPFKMVAEGYISMYSAHRSRKHRIYSVCLPYPADTFGSEFNKAAKRGHEALLAKIKSTVDQQAQIETMARRIDQINFWLRRSIVAIGFICIGWTATKLLH